MSQPIRDAAIVILLRDADTPTPRVLMGQRRRGAVFMPSKFVFPGGAVDPSDADAELADSLDETSALRLSDANPGCQPHALVAAAVRELQEETGLILGAQGKWSRPPPAGWADFAASGHRPLASPLRFVFRAITPPGPPRRFDARFFVANATAVSSDLDDFSSASGELSDLAWFSLEKAATLDLPFITSVVLSEVAARLPRLEPPDTVPFFTEDDEAGLFLRLGRPGAGKAIGSDDG